MSAAVTNAIPISAPVSVDAIVEGGLCIGCGLCAAITGHTSIRMAWTAEERLRPVTEAEIDTETMTAIAAACPGVTVAGLPRDAAARNAVHDDIWGWLATSSIAWAGDPEVRHTGSTGGALNALSIFLLESGEVDAILHVGPDPQYAARSRAQLSRTRADVLSGNGSRYGPTAPLEALGSALAAGKPFAFVGKPCDVSALRLRARDDAALAELCRVHLALVCGGQSEFSKTADLLANWQVEEKQLTDFRYRGHGNPGPTTATLSDGNTRQISYLELWEDETSWALPHRCKICPDAIGMAADIIAADCWPGGAPTGEDAGENAVAARSGVGEDLLKRAFVAGALTRGNTIGIDDLNTFQPHQIRKREAVWARLAGHRAAMRGEDAHGTLTTQDLGIDRIARDQQRTRLLNEARGTRRRVAAGRAREPKPVASRQMAHSQPNI